MEVVKKITANNLVAFHLLRCSFKSHLNSSVGSWNFSRVLCMEQTYSRDECKLQYWDFWFLSSIGRIQCCRCDNIIEDVIQRVKKCTSNTDYQVVTPQVVLVVAIYFFSSPVKLHSLNIHPSLRQVFLKNHRRNATKSKKLITSRTFQSTTIPTLPISSGELLQKHKDENRIYYSSHHIVVPISH